MPATTDVGDGDERRCSAPKGRLMRGAGMPSVFSLLSRVACPKQRLLAVHTCEMLACCLVMRVGDMCATHSTETCGLWLV